MVRMFGVAALVALSGCGGLGACAGYSDILEEDYCYNDFSKQECDDYADEEVNGASWDFYKGDTCSDIGIATN